MSDELENVDAGSETSGEQAAETSQEDTAAEPAEASEEAPADAGGAAEQEQTPAETAAATSQEVDANESRTGFVTGARAGDQCVCPDGRKGTVHSFDSGLVCIPNAEQGN